MGDIAGMERWSYRDSTAIALLHFLFCFASTVAALRPTRLFEGLKVHSHTALFFFFFFLRGLTKVVDPVPESMRRVAGWVRGQDSDEAQEVRGGRLERGQELREKAADAILGTNSYPDPEMT